MNKRTLKDNYIATKDEEYYELFPNDKDIPDEFEEIHIIPEDIDDESEDDEIQIQEDNEQFVEVEEQLEDSTPFIPIKRVSSYMQVDTFHKLIKLEDTIYSYQDIITFELIYDFDENIDVGTTLPFLGALTGSWENFMTGVMLSTEVSTLCSVLQICIETNIDYIYLDFIDYPLRTDEKEYKKRKKDYIECIKLLEKILKDNKA
ncbi:MAG: hypothetical protein IKM20_03255 [Erysipelotrichales bacterium]|nr:hypothetical protein [Erysipelotrichales bacterium]